VSTRDVIAILPLLILAAAAVAVMLSVAIRRRHAVSAALTLAGLIAAFLSLWPVRSVAPADVGQLLVLDSYAVFYIGLILAASIIFVLLAYGYLERCEGQRDELYILMLVATIGSAVLVASAHFVSLFLGLELLSVSLYGMISYLRSRPLPLEAGLKYLVLAAASAAFLLFGMALIYGALGTMQFRQMTDLLSSGSRSDQWLVLPGLALILTGFGFKLALVPFHLWTPDVYEGAPAPVTAYIATVSKGAMFALLVRYFYRSGAHDLGQIFVLFQVIAIASMFAGNILALLQTNVKRMLAYSSIAHLGYVLVAFQVGGGMGAGAVALYLVAYFVTTLGAFGVITVLSDGTHEAEELEDYRGLFWRSPGLAAIFTAMLLSLAGIPATAGFIGKFYVLAAGASSSLWLLLVSVAVTSGLGLFYYLRVVVAMYQASPGTRESQHMQAGIGRLVLAFLTLFLFWLGIFPGRILSVIRDAVAGLT